MVISPESPLAEFVDRFTVAYDDAVVYGDVEGETVLYEGPVRLLGNGWVELPTGRLLSPQAVTHIDAQPEE